jgi:hypothetical protein
MTQKTEQTMPSTADAGAEASPKFVVLDKMEVLGRIDRGIDWGAKRRVLVRNETSTIMLFVREGHSAAVGSRGWGREYHPTSTILYARNSWSGHSGHQTKEVCEGRLDLEAIRSKHGALIEKVLGLQGLCDHLDGRKTIVVPG